MKIRDDKGKFIKGAKMPREYIDKKVRPSGLKYKIKVKNKSWFDKGHIPWTKGTRGLVRPNSGSFKKGEHRSPATEFKSEDVLREKNYHWNGGIQSYRRWAKNRKEKFICSECGYQKQERLVFLHHIDGDRTNNNNDNLEMLCYWCHLARHFPDYRKKICVA